MGNPTGFHLTPGQACDLDGADVLLGGIEADILIADRGYDADKRVIGRLKTLQGLTPVEYICKIWTNEPERFNVDPTHHMLGLNT